MIDIYTHKKTFLPGDLVGDGNPHSKHARIPGERCGVDSGGWVFPHQNATVPPFTTGDLFGDGNPIDLIHFGRGLGGVG